MRISVIHPAELDQELAGVWRRLLSASPLPDSAFLTPEFAVAVGHHRSDARVGVIEDAGENIGFFPYQSRPGGFARALAFGINDFQAIVASPHYDIDFISLLKACGLVRWRFDHLLSSVLLRAGDTSESQVSPVVDFLSGFEQYVETQARVSSGFRRAQRKHHRFTQAHDGVWSFRWNSTDPTTMRRLLDLKGAQCRATGSHDYTTHRWIRSLLEELSTLQGEFLAGVQSELRVGNQVVAMHFGLRTRSRLHWWFPAYETQWARWSPGLSLLLETIKASSEGGLSCLDLGKDLSRYKQEFMNGALRVREGTAHASLRGVLATRVGERIRQSDERSRMFSGLLRPIAGLARRISRRLRYA
jgi:CelD/BcsL family acetyltransferase involved in cellulose biosynthesis